ncbi:hypothetical protein A9K65_014050 [Mesorhizobium sp. WSM1497]|nr:hypothetical protein A9K65_014050 [Mesorhizobium sp. WSM1497]
MFWSAGMRFVLIMDPADQWLVYDEVAGLPAERDGEVLIGLSREAAERLALNANYDCSENGPPIGNPQSSRF